MPLEGPVVRVNRCSRQCLTVVRVIKPGLGRQGQMLSLYSHPRHRCGALLKLK